MTLHEPKLTAAEISNLWMSYQSNTMISCGIKYFLTTVDDDDILDLLSFTLDYTQNRIESIKHIFNEEDYPIPFGFTNQDVNTNAPKLFSDTIVLLYMLNMGRYILTGETMMFALSSRDDIANFYSENLSQSKTLADKGRKLALSKGIYVRAPYLPTPKKAEFVQKQSFLNGWFGDRRPLLGVEIGNLIYNTERNALGEALITGFSQAVQSKEIRQYMVRGRDISTKHFNMFSSVLHNEHLSATKGLTSEVTGATTPPFSDKLMMFHIAGLVSSGIAQYGVAMSTSPRRDLSVMYTRLAAEIAKFAEEGANIMINKGWMEYPPQAADRDNLANQ